MIQILSNLNVTFQIIKQLFLCDIKCSFFIKHKLHTFYMTQNVCSIVQYALQMNFYFLIVTKYIYILLLLVYKIPFMNTKHVAAYSHLRKFSLIICCLHPHSLLSLLSSINARVLLSIPLAICATLISLLLDLSKLSLGASGGNIPCAFINADIKISNSS